MATDWKDVEQRLDALSRQRALTDEESRLLEAAIKNQMEYTPMKSTWKRWEDEIAINDQLTISEKERLLPGRERGSIHARAYRLRKGQVRGSKHGRAAQEALQA